MVILTIKFPRGSKTYDYLMNNKNKVKIDRSKPLKLITGITAYGVSSQEVTLVDARKCECLPGHVTTEMALYEDNCVRTCPIKKDLLKQLSERKCDRVSVEAASHENEGGKLCSLPTGCWGHVTIKQLRDWAVSGSKTLYAHTKEAKSI